jgi:hypothetical protein
LSPSIYKGKRGRESYSTPVHSWRKGRVTERPLGSRPQGLSLLFFRLVVGHGSCWFLGLRVRERERETLQGNNLFLPLPVARLGKKKLYPFKTTPFWALFF